MNKFSGNYPIQHRVGEIERLKIQSNAMAPDTVALLERFGSMTGWGSVSTSAADQAALLTFSARASGLPAG
jgi:hypothetical protein